jgi:hypothetical protein
MWQGVPGDHTALTGYYEELLTAATAHCGKGRRRRQGWGAIERVRASMGRK